MARIRAQHVQNKNAHAKLCKFSGKMKSATMKIVVAFSYAENKEEAPDKAGQGLKLYGIITVSHTT